MAKNKEAFLRSLVETHTARRPLPLPPYRAAAWTGISVALTAGLTLWIQPLRPGSMDHLLAHWVLTGEILGALLAAPLGAYLALTWAVPGAPAPRRASAVLGALILAFAVCLVLSLAHLGAPAVLDGGRPACWLESLCYGLLSLGLLVFMARRALLRVSLARGIALGVTAGLVPGALMQLACMYQPSHGAVFHYGPSLALIALAWILMRGPGRA